MASVTVLHTSNSEWDASAVSPFCTPVLDSTDVLEMIFCEVGGLGNDLRARATRDFRILTVLWRPIVKELNRWVDT